MTWCGAYRGITGVTHLYALIVDASLVFIAYLGAIANAYTHGVNDGLAALGAAPFEYALFGVEPQMLITYTHCPGHG